VHRRLVVLAVEAGLGIGEAVAGQDDLLLDQDRAAIAVVVDLGAGRECPAHGRLEGARGVVDHADLEGRGAAEDVLGLGHVLHARQLDHDAVQALLLDHRLGHAELVDPVVQGGDVLLEGRFLDGLLGQRRQGGGELEVGTVLALGELQVVVGRHDHGAGTALGLGLTELHDHALAVTADPGVADILVAQQAAEVAGGGVEALGDGALHVHLEQEVHATTQVKTQVHGQGVDGGQPLGARRQEVQGDHVGRVGRVRIKGLLDGILGLQLGVGVAEAGAYAGQVGKQPVVLEAGLAEALFDALHHGAGVQLERGLAAGDLDGGNLPVEIRQGVDQAPQQDEPDEEVFPEGIAIHGLAERRCDGRGCG